MMDKGSAIRIQLGRPSWAFTVSFGLFVTYTLDELRVIRPSYRVLVENWNLSLVSIIP